MNARLIAIGGRPMSNLRSLPRDRRWITLSLAVACVALVAVASFIVGRTTGTHTAAPTASRAAAAPATPDEIACAAYLAAAKTAYETLPIRAPGVDGAGHNTDIYIWSSTLNEAMDRLEAKITVGTSDSVALAIRGWVAAQRTRASTVHAGGSPYTPAGLAATEALSVQNACFLSVAWLADGRFGR